MHEYILRNWHIVKITTTKAQHKLFFNLRSAKKRLGWLNQDKVNSVAKDLGVKPSEVLEMEKRLSNYDASFDGTLEDDENDVGYAPAIYLEGKSDCPEQQLATVQIDAENHAALISAIDTLDDRSRQIISKRWLAEKKTTLRELAEIYNVSAERIRQIEESAMKKIRETFVPC